jgi:hypothetical protein
MNYDTYSDLHKDAYGFRPRNWDAIRSWSPAEFEAACIRAVNDLDHAIEAEKRTQAAAAVAFEATVARLIAAGAGDRATAIRWLADAADAGDDLGYLEYAHNLPYGYLGK